MILAPDEYQADVYKDIVALNVLLRATFAHGLNVHFNLIEPRADLDVL